MNRDYRVSRSCLLLLACTAGACSPAEDTAPLLSVDERLSGGTAGYPKVTEVRPLQYPDDHGPHQKYKHEWWYVTGQVKTRTQRRFGFQLTIFREAISNRPANSSSRWAANQLYLAHASVTDIETGQYLSGERFARGALGLAGASAQPFRVWLEDWRLEGRVDGDGSLEGHTVAATGRFGFELAIRNARPPVAHGDRGMSTKGPAGNASYYYSYTRLDARGTVRVDGEPFDVTGSAWFDHEWSSSTLTAGQSGWDWFSLQLSSGADLMVFRLRNESNPTRDFYSGTFVDAFGNTTNLASEQISMEPLDHWTSNRTGVRYPRRWRVSVPRLNLMLVTEPRLNDQEFVHSFRYWEGAVRVAGRHDGVRVGGQGYVELTGYSLNARR
ncbi:MAG: hypothetical protein MAG794_01667 [Gammaproteobacteria bacterium]|nr:hypothetical protein [Gammaproteobacteria bacterium]